MKLKKDFVLKNVAGNFVVFPVGEATVDFRGMLALNETGAFLWEKLADGSTKNELCTALCNEYDIDSATAQADVDSFIKKLEDAGCIEL
jgi:hypothetical protein